MGNIENMVMARVGVVGAKCTETVLESEKTENHEVFRNNLRKITQSHYVPLSSS